MLTADQIQVLGDKAEGLLSPVVEFLMGDIAQRVSEAGQLTATAAYMTWVAQTLGKSQKEVKKEVAKLLKKAQEEVEKLMKQAAKTGYLFDLNRLPTHRGIPFEANSSLQQIMDGYVALAQEDLKNITQTMGFVTPYGEAKGLTEAYRDTCDFAFKKVTTGAQDFTGAVRDAMKNLADKGIVRIDYESGVHTSAEAAARRSVMGGMGLMQEHISQINHDDLKCDGWEISAHWGSAPDHEPIQGKQYTDAEYKALNGRLKRRIGTLNCGHSAFPVILGIQKPMYTEEELEKFRLENEAGFTLKDGKHYTLYEATQQQRAMERGIRKRQRQILLDKKSGDEEKLTWDQVRLIRQKEAYEAFCEETKLREKYERTEVAEFSMDDWKNARATAKPILRFDKKHLASDQTELLRNYKDAVIPVEKLKGYALNPEHPTGKHKALVFQKVLGYNADNQDKLISQVRSGLRKYRAIEKEKTEYGEPFEVAMMVQGANGRFAPVKTAWQIDKGGNTPRLVSIYVDKEGA